MKLSSVLQSHSFLDVEPALSRSVVHMANTSWQAWFAFLNHHGHVYMLKEKMSVVKVPERKFIARNSLESFTTCLSHLVREGAS